jgi:hypothetical protein
MWTRLSSPSQVQTVGLGYWSQTNSAGLTAPPLDTPAGLAADDR